MILFIDNYDSFTYNLVQLIGSIEMAEEFLVVRNDEISLEQIEQRKPSHIILSPGPGKPKDAGICEEVIRKFHKEIPILGVCLGHQAICEVFGATISYAKSIMHGKQSVIMVDSESKLFRGLEETFSAARYHSLAAVRETIPEALKVTAVTQDSEIMAIEHKEYPIYGVQFHPESVLTPNGKTIMENFLKK
ncbi:anthranilate synthase component II [Lachnoclostridium phytofermentans]|uniref:Glutamine amidotransferase of anthranilate synthase n=1 Tax=Lachnoclostridium phytofermentans (strain ATCC 700394 / DSM 18823 / ISDg) TaxID=357809 RepID=A9KL45_LACP7|nr:aminodeoxychorismate/anthranilate synthase component II [Lachnoclostridium phytofermentans]ABX44194.1 glutamine amidotransferase of anthranilate synthase [Lachnoclostridium phytofermentans ISDg]